MQNQSFPTLCPPYVHPTPVLYISSVRIPYLWKASSVGAIQVWKYLTALYVCSCGMYVAGHVLERQLMLIRGIYSSISNEKVAPYTGPQKRAVEVIGKQTPIILDQGT